MDLDGGCVELVQHGGHVADQLGDPGDQNDLKPDASGNATMLGAFERVLAETTGQVLPTRYDIAGEDGVFHECYCKPLNEPVFDDDANIVYIIHGVQDVTASVLVPATARSTCPPGANS